MAWDFLKKLVGGKGEGKKPPPFQIPVAARPPAPKAGSPAAPPVVKQVPDDKVLPVPVKEKAPSEKTDDELAAELDKMSPRILAQAKDPRMRALIINIYRRMLIDGVNINDDKEVKKWMKKHPEALQGGEDVKVETVRREEPKVGRNDPCSCGSGKKYKKCCGAGG